MSSEDLPECHVPFLWPYGQAQAGEGGGSARGHVRQVDHGGGDSVTQNVFGKSPPALGAFLARAVGVVVVDAADAVIRQLHDTGFGVER